MATPIFHQAFDTLALTVFLNTETRQPDPGQLGIFKQCLINVGAKKPLPAEVNKTSMTTYTSALATANLDSVLSTPVAGVYTNAADFHTKFQAVQAALNAMP